MKLEELKTEIAEGVVFVMNHHTNLDQYIYAAPDLPTLGRVCRTVLAERLQSGFYLDRISEEKPVVKAEDVKALAALNSAGLNKSEVAQSLVNSIARQTRDVEKWNAAQSFIARAQDVLTKKLDHEAYELLMERRTNDDFMSLMSLSKPDDI